MKRPPGAAGLLYSKAAAHTKPMVEIRFRPVHTSRVHPEASALLRVPADCQSKEEVRAEIDRIDQAVLELLAERHRYVTRMAEIKTDPHEAFDPARIETVIAKQRSRAEALGLDEDQAELIWRTLINWNVNYEKGIIVARRRSEQT